MTDERPPKVQTFDVLIVGGGVGGCAAALAVTSLGLTAFLAEETDWIGGQLTSQVVPPDEHPWIEHFGSTHRYREYRKLVREFYQTHYSLSPTAMADPYLNPGGGWVSRLCHEPKVGLAVLERMLQPAILGGLLKLSLRTKAISAHVHADKVNSIDFSREGEQFSIEAKLVLDATEVGSVLPLAGIEYVVGAESQAETGEPNALPGLPERDNVQGITWCAVFSNDPGSHRIIDRPAQYDKWREWIPSNWCGPMLSLKIADPFKGGTRELPVFGDFSLFTYRQIVNPEILQNPTLAATSVNWPQNDYFEGTILDVPERVVEERLESSRQLTLSLLYWLQTEMNFPGLHLRPDLTGTHDGLAMAPYIREARRIKARFTITENHVSASAFPGLDRAAPLPKSVGVGSYRLDLHPGSNGAPTLDLSTVPFQIPLGSLIPVRIKNLLPAGKNLGVTHIANGCYRLHPIEWNIGESAGLLAGFSILKKIQPSDVLDESTLWEDFQDLLIEQGIEIAWPADERLKAL